MNKKDYQRITITIEDDLLDEIDSYIEQSDVSSRSQAINELTKKGLGVNQVKTAVILAGGKGTRLRPITYELPKPLVPIKDKALTDHILALLKKHGVERVIFSIGYLADEIKGYFGDGSRYGLEFIYVKEEEKLGTAGPLKLAQKYLDDTFYLVWCDILADIDLSDLAQFHKEHEGLATLALTSVDDPSSFGVLKLKGSKVVDFIEKPKKGEASSNLINAGIAVLEPEILEYIPEGPSMIEEDVYPKLVEEEKLYGYPFDGQWFDTGTYENYQEALKNWQKE